MKEFPHHDISPNHEVKIDRITVRRIELADEILSGLERAVVIGDLNGEKISAMAKRAGFSERIVRQYLESGSRKVDHHLGGGSRIERASPPPVSHEMAEVAISESWRDGAACRNEDPELFFPVGNTPPAKAQTEDAKEVCRDCNVRTRCLEHALATGQDSGVWGGMSEDERRRLKRKNARGRTA